MALRFGRIRDARGVHPLLRGQYVFQVSDGGSYNVYYFSDLDVRLSPHLLSGVLEPLPPEAEARLDYLVRLHRVPKENPMRRDISLLLAIGKTLEERQRKLLYEVRVVGSEISFEDLTQATQARAIKRLMPDKARQDEFLMAVKRLWDDAIRLRLQAQRMVEDESI